MRELASIAALLAAGSTAAVAAPGAAAGGAGLRALGMELAHMCDPKNSPIKTAPTSCSGEARRFLDRPKSDPIAAPTRPPLPHLPGSPAPLFPLQQGSDPARWPAQWSNATAVEPTPSAVAWPARVGPGRGIQLRKDNPHSPVRALALQSGVHPAAVFCSKLAGPP